MQERLVIFLTADGVPAWIFVGADGQAAARLMTGDASELAVAAAGKEVIAIVPGEDVLLTSAVLPKLSRSRLLQALPYAIEDQLTSDVENLHFVPAEVQEDGATPVAVVSQDKMRGWVAQLQSWRIQADDIISATLALPLEEDVWHVAVSDMALIRTGALSGVSCDVVELNTWLSIALASAMRKPRSIHVHNYSGQSVVLTLPVEIREDQLPPEQWYQDAAQQTSTPHINLLSSGFASRKAKFPQMTRVRKIVTYLGAAWLVLLLLYPLVSYVTLKSCLSDIQGQMWQIYKKQFPQATNMGAPRVRMEEKLHKAGASLGQNKFLMLMAYVGEAKHKATDVTIKRMDFQSGNVVTLDLSTTTEAFSVFTDYLSQQGLQVKQQNASVSGERVNATVQVE